MTNIEPAAYPLMLLYRLQKSAPSAVKPGIFLGHGKLDNPESYLRERLDLAQQFVAARSDLFQLVSAGRWDTEQSLVFDADAPRPSLADLAGELHDHAERVCRPGDVLRPRSDYELLAAVIALGNVNGTYGSTYWGSEQDVFHLLACGVNWKLHMGVGEVSWSEWGGTFAEDTTTTKFGTTVRCRCSEESWESGLDFGLEPPSISQLLSALGAGALERVFNL